MKRSFVKVYSVVAYMNRCYYSSKKENFDVCVGCSKTVQRIFVTLEKLLAAELDILLLNLTNTCSILGRKKLNMYYTKT